MTEDWRARFHHGWEALGVWQPLATALLAVLVLLLAQQTWWMANAETDPAAIWESRELNDDSEMWTFLYRETAAPRDGAIVLFRGTIEISPRFSVMRNGTILPGEYSPMDGLVYKESLYGSTILRLDGLPILIHGNLSGQFFANEIVTVRARMVWNSTDFISDGQNVSLVRQGWEADPRDIQLTAGVDRWFFGASVGALLLGGWASAQRVPGLRDEMRAVLWLARFEARRGLRSPRTFVLALFFTLFIVAGFGLPALWTRIGPEHRGRNMSWAKLVSQGIVTHTGRVKAGDAAVQMLILPALIFCWGIATVTIAAFV